VVKDTFLLAFFQNGLLFLPDMNKTEYRIVGVMSGTSLDGIDLVYVSFYNKTDTWSYKIHSSETVTYSKKWFSTLKHLVSKSIKEVVEIDANYTQFLAKIIKEFIKNNHIHDIDAVCSHGHTALHQPENKLTYQIGNLPSFFEILQETIVCNFRIQDVELGGQGAPLVPIGDKLLFKNYEFCLNLGGFANISTEVDEKRIAYDICPVNIVLNHYVSFLKLDFDDEGKIASTGTIQKELLETLNSLEFYKQNYPKSLGLEWVEREVLPIIDSYNLVTKDILRTFIEHVAIQISQEINKASTSKVLITGGGAYHKFLIERIQSMTLNKLIIPENTLIEFKEAIVFGFLGVLKLREEVNCLSSVTGAKHDHSSGIIYKH